MGSGKHEVQFVTELEPFVLIDRTNRKQCMYGSQALRDLHERQCDSLALIQNGMRLYATLWSTSIMEYDTMIDEYKQCRDVRKRRMIGFKAGMLHDSTMKYETKQETCEVAFECAIDNAYLQATGRQSTTESVIPSWYWTI